MGKDRGASSRGRLLSGSWVGIGRGQTNCRSGPIDPRESATDVTQQLGALLCSNESHLKTGWWTAPQHPARHPPGWDSAIVCYALAADLEKKISHLWSLSKLQSFFFG
jgi:hypothetical protein